MISAAQYNIISAQSSKPNIAIVQDSLSLADFVIYSFLVDFFDDKEGIAFSMRSCAKLKKLVELVGSNGRISGWRESRPSTPF